MIYTIYKHTNTKTKRHYIGISMHGMIFRWEQHVNNALSFRVENSYFYKAIRKYGVNTWEHSVLFTTKNKKEAFVKEIEFIKSFNSFGDNGYNLTIGGEGSSGRLVSDKTKELIRNTRLNTSSSETAKAKISASLIGNTRRKGVKATMKNLAKISGVKAVSFRPWFIKHRNGKVEQFFDITIKDWAKQNDITLTSIRKRFMFKYLNKFGVTTKSFWFNKSCGYILPTEAGMPILEAGKR